MSLASAWARRSVDVSTRIDRTAAAIGDPSAGGSSIRIDGRVRLSRGSTEWHTAQSQPIAGTPCDVPLPRMVTRSIPGLWFDNALAGIRGLDKAHAQLVEHLLEHLSLLGGEIA